MLIIKDIFFDRVVISTDIGVFLFENSDFSFYYDPESEDLPYSRVQLNLRFSV